jgi:predicted nucleotidyltransferase
VVHVAMDACDDSTRLYSRIVFSVEERDRVRKRLLELAEADAEVVGAAITGSYVADGGDEWSDIDLAFAVLGELSTALARWTDVLYDEFAAVHHWDLPWGSSVYRVFLLPEWLEVDIAFTPAAEFGARGPNWRTVFGETVDVPPAAPVAKDELVGLGWHHVLHARTCIERGKLWQAEWLISGIREHVLALACLGLGYATRFAKCVDELPAELTVPLEETLVRSLDDSELRRALAAAAAALATELERTDPELAERLRPMLLDIASPTQKSATSLRVC